LSAQRADKEEESPTNVEGVTISEGLDIVDALDLKLLNDRIVVINDDIDPWIAGKLTRIFQVLAVKQTPITILISSNGGELDAGSTILRAMQHASSQGCKLVGEVRGYAMSMAAVILQHCDKRFAAPDDVIMVHGPTGSTFGSIRHQDEDAKLMKRAMSSWAHFLAERNTSTDSRYKDKDFWYGWLMDNLPHYFLGHEALEAGLIDEVIL